jgi:Domain of unknown function (DUF4303)
MIDINIREVRSNYLLKVATETIKKFKREHKNECLYAFTLISPPEGSSVCCAFATEEGLTNIATNYINNHPRIARNNILEDQRLSLRWLNPDEGWHYYFFDSEFSEFWLRPFTTGELNLFDESTESICVSVLQRLDETNIFGSETERNRIVLGFTYGSDPDDFMNFAKEVNPPQVYSRLCDEIRESRKVNGVASPI